MLVANGYWQPWSQPLSCVAVKAMPRGRFAEMSPVGGGEISLTKFYRLPALSRELGSVAPGMTEGQVQTLLGAGHQELADDLVLYSNGLARDDPLLSACRTGSSDRLLLLWVALVMADHRLASVVEDILTDRSGKLIPQNFDTDRLEGLLPQVLPGTTRKTATNILSYYRDSGLVLPEVRGNTTTGISQALPTSQVVPSVVSYVSLRLEHLGLAAASDGGATELALRVRANSWLNLTSDEFRAAAGVDVPRVGGPATDGPSNDGRQPGRRRTTGGRPSPAPARPATTTEVEVEANNTERFVVTGQERREARRREQPLVLAYKSWMQARGSEIVRLRYTPFGALDALYCDLYDKTRNNLLEAKGSQTRPAIRMAIGQLADYRRFSEPAPRCAVLTPERPREDLESLLRSCGVACVWRHGDEFLDNADGRFV